MAQPQRGKASFYSKRASGTRTANGDRLHHDSLTCAHRTYPFGTLLKVTNLSNGKEVIVRVNDRGPFGRGRIIDLSWGAAKELDMIAQGVTTVQVELYQGAKGVPYREDEILDLPEIDFEVADAGYSFIDAWKADKEEEKELPVTKTAPKQKAAKTVPSAEAPKNPAAPSAVRKPKTKEKEKGNKWSNVFDKIKNWGKDIF